MNNNKEEDEILELSETSVCVCALLQLEIESTVNRVQFNDDRQQDDQAQISFIRSFEQQPEAQSRVDFDSQSTEKLEEFSAITQSVLDERLNRSKGI